MNTLKKETSPYLLQHANNPVHWMAWGREAFTKAEKENKPILVSIGYSSCHWCHVMEHESFEDIETASLMNTLFVNIKVDREEYPDVDHMYMDAVQAMTGSGGWPLNVFLTPDKKPFYGGTYFPPLRAHGRPSWKEVLINVSQYFTQNRQDVDTQSAKLIEHLKQQASNLNSQPSELDYTDDLCTLLKDKIMANADLEEGGFGAAPKFPSTFSILFLLNYYSFNDDKTVLKHALLSLEKMMMGGIYDHLGGGFSRYSTDKYWIAPHFEKMLYDNALFMEVYAIAYSITKEAKYKIVIDQTIGWLKREMMSSEFGFYSAQDADSEGVEGKYYTWSSEELKKLIPNEYEWFSSYYNMTEEGNWEHTNILYHTFNSEALLTDEMRLKLDAIHQLLFKSREQRVKPMTDDKIILGWNALMNKALVNAYIYTGENEYLDLAEKNINFILSKLRSTTHLYYHTYKDGVAKIPAYADDLAYLIDALICIGNATANAKYYHDAYEIAIYMDQHFSDQDSRFYHMTNNDFQQVEVNKKEIYDGATPSSNSIMCKVLNQLYAIFQHPPFNKRSQALLQSMSDFLQKYPGSFSLWCTEFLNRSKPEKEISILGEDAKKYYVELRTQKYRPEVMYMTSIMDVNIAGIKGKYQVGETLIYICKNSVCLEPLRDVNMAFTEI